MKRTSLAAVALAGSSIAASAQDAVLHPGQPHPWQVNLQEALSPIEAQIHWFSNYTLWFIVPIVIFVAGLLAWVSFRYNEKRNATPSRTSHNTIIEVVWTLAPVLILLILPVLIDRFSKRVPPVDRGAHGRDVGHRAPGDDAGTEVLA